MKRYRSLLFAMLLAVLLMTFFPAKAQAEEYGGQCGENVFWFLNEDGTLTISGIGPMFDYQYSDYAPWDARKYDIKQLIVEQGVTHIGQLAFRQCENLIDVTLPEGLVSIGDMAFQQSSSLGRLVIPDGVTYLGSNAFYLCYSLTEVSIPDSITYIGKACFFGCVSLKAAVIPGGVFSIEPQTFQRCTALENVTISPGVMEIKEGAFEECEALIQIVLPDTVSYLGTRCFSKCKSLQFFEIPEGVSSIAAETFSGCTSLEQVLISEGVTAIGGSAFAECGKLVEANLPGTVSYLGEKCFLRCASLREAAIPEGVGTIGDYLFSGCSALRKVYIPDGVTEIGRGAFVGCKFLTEVDIPESVVAIGEYCFRGCRDLQSVVIPDGITSIEAYSFKECTHLEQISVPLSVTRIGEEAFDGCDDLQNAYYPGSDREWHNIDIGAGNDNLLNASIHFGIADHEHDYDAQIVSPNCMMAGYTIHICFCGDSYTTDPTDALGHEFDGETCIRCGARNVTSEFADVKPEDYFSQSVTWAVEHGITAGTGVGKFSPNDPCTRGQVVTFLWRIMGKTELYHPINPYGDVRDTDYFYSAVLWANRRGVASGISAEAFSPNGTCTRAQVVTFLWRLMGREYQTDVENPFTDVKFGDYYYHAVLWAVQNGITSGVSANTFAPNAPCTRGQVVTFLGRTFRLDKLPEPDRPYTVGIPQYAGVYGKHSVEEPPVYNGWTDYNSVVNRLNGYTMDVYGRRFFRNGMAVNDNDPRGTADIVQDETGRFGVRILGWRHSYESDASDNLSLNTVLEAMYYFTGDREIAYNLWRCVDHLAIEGAANTTGEMFGFTESSLTDTSVLLSCDTCQIFWDWSTGDNIFWFLTLPEQNN